MYHTPLMNYDTVTITSLVSVATQHSSAYNSLSFAENSVLILARSIVERCQRGALTSMYSHDNKEIDGELRFNCYGFIGHILNTNMPEVYQAVTDFMMKNAPTIPLSIDNKPCPFHFAEFFSSLSTESNDHWVKVSRPQQLQPGDFIVYLPVGFVPKAITSIQERRTGTHIMLVEEVLVLTPKRIELSIIDCTREPHSPDETRKQGGIGRSSLTIHLEFGKTLLQWGKRERFIEKQLFFGRIKGF